MGEVCPAIGVVEWGDGGVRAGSPKAMERPVDVPRHERAEPRRGNQLNGMVGTKHPPYGC